MFQVQKTCWLIQQQYGCLLCKCSCNEDTLPLAAAEMAKEPAGKLEGIGSLKRFMNCLVIGRAFKSEPAKKGGSCHRDRLNN